MDDNNQSPSDARRERRVQRQKRAIMDAAAHLFAEQGYASTTTKEIAEAADVGESTLYSYFQSKKEMLVAILNEQASMFDVVFGQVKKIDTREQMVTIIDTGLERLFANVVYSRALIAEAWTNDEVFNHFVANRFARMMELISLFLNREIAAGLMRPMNVEMGARMMIAVMLGAILPILRGIEPPPSSVDERRALAGIIVEFMLTGLAGKFDEQEGV